MNLVECMCTCLFQCDLEERQVEQEEIEQFCRDNHFIGWTEVSVKDGLMVEESMQ